MIEVENYKINCVDTAWYKKVMSWVWIAGSALVGAVVDGAGNGIINYLSGAGGKIHWKSLFSSMTIGALLSVGNLMVHSPRHNKNAG